MLLLTLAVIMGGYISIFYWPVGLGIAVVCVILSLFPLEGYSDENLLKTIMLIPLEDTEDGAYIRQIGNKIYYAHDIRGRYGLPSVAREISYVRGKVKIYESQECQSPVLKIYEKKPLRQVAAIAPFSTKTTYVFYIPKKELTYEGDKKSQQVDVEVV